MQRFVATFILTIVATLQIESLAEDGYAANLRGKIYLKVTNSSKLETCKCIPLTSCFNTTTNQFISRFETTSFEQH